MKMLRWGGRRDQAADGSGERVVRFCPITSEDAGFQELYRAQDRRPSACCLRSHGRRNRLTLVGVFLVDELLLKILFDNSFEQKASRENELLLSVVGVVDEVVILQKIARKCIRQ